MQSDARYRALYVGIAYDVLWGSVLSLLLFLVSGKQSAIPLSGYLVFRMLRLKSMAAQSQHPNNEIMQNGQEIGRLRLALAEQQQQHLATIRKMKLEQNEILLKHHELQHVLQQQQ